MDTELHRLLGEVERYLKKSGVPASTFGLSIVNDRAMVLRMRRGKAITSKNMSLIRAFMAENKHLRKPKKIQIGRASCRERV